jgi:hypothetical protein
MSFELQVQAYDNIKAEDLNLGSREFFHVQKAF